MCRNSHWKTCNFLAKGRIEDVGTFFHAPVRQPRELSAIKPSWSYTKAPNLSRFCVQLPHAQLKAADVREIKIQDEYCNI